jgi:cyclin-dependent kinase
MHYHQLSTLKVKNGQSSARANPFKFGHIKIYDEANFTPMGKVGEGSYGVVTKAVDHTKRGAIVALKKLKCSEGGALTHLEGLSHNLLREITVLEMLKNSPNFVQLVDFYFHPRLPPEASCFVLSFEFADGGDLHKYI